MVMIHVKGRIYQQNTVKCAGSQHLDLGDKEKNGSLEYKIDEEAQLVVRSVEKVRNEALIGVARVRGGPATSIF